ncbi:hypothetical protein [Empedobacter tilapiae]|uniref:Uncharacterized protein n=1 Tax=Empedobacter tilapiae TaxID=2491114 RepID=A0A4Z1B5P4_9FLAO|nr:hypothetical protein [Empedobacter tilapiae]TGN22537.1 hypothetical protein E4J94_15950 [Empedobacter tilapiae]
MNTKIEYHYLTKFGALKGFYKSNPNLEKKTLLVLDSSVCLDIVNIVNKKNINKDSKRKVFELIKYSQKKSMPPFEIFALLELSLDKATYKLNTEKFFDISNKLMFAFQIPLERLKTNNFDFSSNFFSSKKPNLNNDASVFVEQILIHYSALLKIREIASKDLSKHKAKENIIEFVDWMNNKIGLILGLEYQLAFQIFGGNNSFNTMIKENSSKEKTLKALWGSSWDLLHARLSRNSKQLSEIIDEDVNSIFITNDKRLFELLSPQVEYSTEFDKRRISITTGKSNYPPYYDDKFVDELNKKILDIFKHKAMKQVEYPNTEIIKSMIASMESNVT